MKKLITNESPPALIHAYMNNPVFHAVVKKNEIAGTDYTQMLEEAIVMLVNDIDIRNNMLINYANQLGPIRI